MSLTRIQAETELVKRQGERMALVGFAVSIAGSNADLNSPLAQALRKMGYSASSTVSDSDLSVLASDEIDEFYDRAELRLLLNIKGNLVMTDITVGPRSEKLGQLAIEIQNDIADLKERVNSEYGLGGSLEAGVLALNFQQKDDEDDE